MPDPDRVLGKIVYDERDALVNLLEALKLAESSARQLAYLRQQPQWFLVQNTFEAARDVVMKLATGKEQPFHHKFLS